MRTSHSRTRPRTSSRTAFLVAVAAASLGLTACGGGGEGARDAGSAMATQQPTGPETTTGAETTTDATATPTPTQATPTPATPAPATPTQGTAGSAPDAKTPVCAHGDVKITAAKADEVPTEHIVLTATNTSARACRLLGHPLLAFGAIQTAKDVPPVAKSKPAAPVVLDPGAPAYANVRVSAGGVHEDNKVVKEFTVNLLAADGPAEGSVVVAAPEGGIAVDEAIAKTGYWTPELRNGADEF
ncbi:DUF4232 domain-containing protein [Streptomyces sp. NPDC058486]|uniref:DUF4232 domain-containing protein n=1 Tax=Streptomyces sp. NPDC058486 TaxID=3346526 RepID=UPI00365B5086